MMAGERETSVWGRVHPLRLPLRHQIGLLALVVLALLPLGQMVGLTSVTVLGLVTVPLSIDAITMLKLTSALYFGIFAMSWDTVSGYTGQISFGHGFFFAIGGYTSTLLNLGWGVDPLLSIPAGALLAAVGGIVIGVPALRLHGPYLSLVTLVAPLILLQIFIMRSDVFGGELGLGQPDNFLGFGLDDAVAVYYVAFATFVLVTLVLLAVTRSDAGMVFTGIREDEEAMSASGINTAKFKTFAFVLSALVGGLAGAMLVHTPRGAAQPSQLLVLTVNIEVIIAAILGGMGTIVGAAIGGFFLVMFRDVLSSKLAVPVLQVDPSTLAVRVGEFNVSEQVVPLLNARVGDLDFLIFAVVTLLLLFVLPGGFLRWGIRIGRRLHAGAARRLGRGSSADGGRDDDAATRGSAPSDVERTPLEQVYENYRDAIRELHERRR